MSAEKIITKENLDFYLKELAKEFRKRNKTKVHAEIILVGGASVLANYGFREMTTDIDAIISANSVMKEAVNVIGDRYNLPYGWLHADFLKTSSYSSRLIEHSEYYKTFANVLEIRTVKAEYLVAMKLVSGRRYKKDLSDIIGIFYEQEKKKEPLDYEKINCAVLELYGSWDRVDDYTKSVLEQVLKSDNLVQLFEARMAAEIESKDTILEIEQKYPDVINSDNVNDIIEQAKRKKSEVK